MKITASHQPLSNPVSRDPPSGAADSYTHGPWVLVGCPNLAAIQTMLGAYDYRIERLSDWAGLLRDNPRTDNCGDYANRKRITARCADSTAAPA
jgi:hypothetical protein